MAKGPITKDTLKETIDEFELEVGSEKKKDMKEAIKNYLEEKYDELPYECPSCGEQVPEVPKCPFCREEFQFEEDTNDSEEENEEAEENEQDEEVEEKEEKSKKKGKKEKKEKKGKKKADYSMYEKAVETADEVLDDAWEKRERKSGVSYFKEQTRLMKIIKKGNGVSVEINVDIDVDIDGYERLDEKTIESKKLGSTKGLFTGTDMDNFKKVIKAALKEFKPAERIYPFQKKKEEKKEEEE